ncbi:MAG: nitric oxide reductase F protein [Roseovarius sp.]|nr:nitric oxide reductase F protein [Roseovarius sp.]MBK44801.1 nitric oxide reductase F protein [Roseovarius sp.]|tara:strand:- start:89 stop:367 length:279 start_codon:yes stop_codon:yes gene_type:complete
MTVLLRDPLLRAWGVLLGLSLGSTALSLRPWPTELAAPAGAVILTLAWLKARVILARYLGLAAAPSWRRGFDLALALFCLLLLGLYLLPLAV